MKRVMVTGATGFIGRHTLSILLAHGYEVHAISFSSDQPQLDGIRWHRTNLLDAGAVSELVTTVAPSHLLHFAWFAVPGKYQASEENFRWCQAGIELLLAFARSGGQRAVFAGTCFEYDLRHGYCSEELTPCAPSSRYGVCKLSLAQIATAFPPESVSTAWGRIFYLYGPHESPARLVPSVILSLIRGERAPCTHGRQVRDFLHVEDVASAFVSLLESDARGVVNIGSGEPVTIRSIVERIASLLDAAGRIDFGAIEAASSDPAVVLAATGRIRGETVWSPHWPLADGLAATIDWWRAKPLPNRDPLPANDQIFSGGEPRNRST